MRVIYADILFVLNVYITYGLLLLTAFISKTSVRRPRLLLSSLLSGLYSLIILVEVSDLVLSLSRIPVCFLLIFVGFRVVNKRHFLRLTVSFFGVNFGFAGLMLALWYFFAPDSMYYNNGIVYFDIDALTLVVLTAVCWLVLRCIFRVLSFRVPHNTVYDLHIYYKGEEFVCRSLLDTGNSLSDPFTSYPVIIVQKKVFGNIFGEKTDISSAADKGLRFIVCSTLGGDGLLPCFKPSEVKIKSLEGSFVTDRIVVALTDKKLKNGEFDAILSPDLFVNEKCERGDSYVKKIY